MQQPVQLARLQITLFLDLFRTALSLFLNLISASTVGDVEKKIHRADGNLKEIKVAVNSIAARMMATSDSHDGSVMTAYANDDRNTWRELRRELAGEGIMNSVVRKHKRIIMTYMKDLGSRGILDAVDINEAEADATSLLEELEDPRSSLKMSSTSTVQEPETELIHAFSPMSRDEKRRLKSSSSGN